MTIKRHFVKKAISIGLSATLALSAVGFSALATSDEDVFPSPTAATSVVSSVLTTTSQRAASEIPLVFGVNVVQGTLFNGPIDMAGTDVNEVVDPYLYNYNFVASGGIASPYYNDGSVVSDLGTQYNADGLYSSGGANQVYSGGVGYVDTFFGFNSNVFADLQDDEADGVIVDVQTGSTTSRLYSWAEMGAGLSGYLSSSKTLRYGDAYTIGLNVEQFSAGIPYYIAYLIDSGTLTKKTAAFVTGYDSGTYTCKDPSGMGDVRSDMFAEAGNFDFVSAGTYSATDLEDAGVSLVILSATGYSYIGGGNGTDSLSSYKSTIVSELNTTYTAASKTVPIVMSGTNYNITIGNNGYNYSPITCMFLPYVQAYAYMDQLQSANSAINPLAMVEYMIDEFFHVNDSNVAAVADYYIGSKWDASVSGDKVPTNYSTTYSKTAIESAIQTGIRYALGLSDSSTHTLVAAYRNNDTAYSILTNEDYYVESKPSDTTYYISVEIDGTDEYILIDTVAAAYPTLATYYGYTDSSNTTHDGTYNYGWDLQETLQYYADHMNAHVWDPVTSQSGTYGYNLSALTIS
ncbi:MAG: hypothetical protein LUC94_09830 [Clostridiales bacterium]|nr:hypothetical protein [Clostridiales bacterium]